MPTTAARDWMTSELEKGLLAERALADESKARVADPVDASLAGTYLAMAEAEERYHLVLEVIAIRYGYTPRREGGGNIGHAIGWLRGKMSGLGESPFDRLTYDLVARATSLFWGAAWVHTFKSLGDVQSAGELEAIVVEKRAYFDALQAGLNRLVEERAKSTDAATRPAKPGVAPTP